MAPCCGRRRLSCCSRLRGRCPEPRGGPRPARFRRTCRRGCDIRDPGHHLPGGGPRDGGLHVGRGASRRPIPAAAPAPFAPGGLGRIRIRRSRDPAGRRVGDDADVASLPVFLVLVVFGVASAATWAAGIQLSKSTDELDRRLGIGDALGGMVLLAIAGSLPELAITISVWAPRPGGGEPDRWNSHRNDGACPLRSVCGSTPD